MTITRLHMGMTLLIALTLHAGIALWLVLPASEPLPKPTEQVIRISLQASIAETTTNTATEPTPEPILKPKPRPQPVAKPKPKPVSKPAKPRPVDPPPEPATETVVEPTPEVIQAEATEPATTAPDTAATARYEQFLVAWLEKHKRYPRRAKRLRIEGEGLLRILIDRSGRTQEVTLEQRTGNRLLDKAALEMAQRADPFPPFPNNDTRSELEFIVPVAFVLH